MNARQRPAASAPRPRTPASALPRTSARLRPKPSNTLRDSSMITGETHQPPGQQHQAGHDQQGEPDAGCRAAARMPATASGTSRRPAMAEGVGITPRSPRPSRTSSTAFTRAPCTRKIAARSRRLASDHARASPASPAGPRRPRAARRRPRRSRSRWRAWARYSSQESRRMSPGSMRPDSSGAPVTRGISGPDPHAADEGQPRPGEHGRGEARGSRPTDSRAVDLRGAEHARAGRRPPCRRSGRRG